MRRATRGWSVDARTYSTFSLKSAAYLESRVDCLEISRYEVFLAFKPNGLRSTLLNFEEQFSPNTH